ncbi:TPA: YbjQ family protein [Clostridioides difficile]|uniref:YbjQ family protein n=1 Tax=Clostridioides TaxID=1870884 RepID=UPI00038D31B8|nr:YbjQ family protein [Clostridioides difficile]MCC0738400.1 YbjQ family protein [Clostridioides sp. ZZV14-5902]EQK05556.1 heavy-metal-binding family protein [Clostridioides difficile P59]MBG0194394.1 YbjQ family protein [Clostridioides difficile]MBG0211729.1 YbjQ family protein [Clostridioides difficile]MBH7225801.1 YbjQ family protein [Clostridioides difficile]
MIKYIVKVCLNDEWRLDEILENDDLIPIYSSKNRDDVIKYARDLALTMKPSKLVIEDENKNMQEEMYLKDKCRKCGERLPENSSDDLCKKCLKLIEEKIMAEKQKLKDEEEKIKKEKDIEAKINILKDNPSLVLISTTPQLEGYDIEEYISIESGEVVLGSGLFSDIKSGIMDTLGSRSVSYENKLTQARKEALYILKQRAILCGGNAVVGIDIDYFEMSGLFSVITNGTVVRINKK